MADISTLFSNLIGAGAQAFLGGVSQMHTYNMQKDYNKKMWDLNNKYNSPIEQYNRLIKTGMSPSAAIQALAGGNTNGPLTAPNANVPFESGITNIGNILSNIPRSAAEVENIESSTRNNNVNADATENKVYYEIEQYKSQIDKINKELGLTDKQIEYQSILNKYADKKSQADIDNILTQRNLIEQQIKNLKEDEQKAAWENFYRTNFGIDPSSNYMNMLITASLKGDMENVFNAFEKTANTIWKKAKEYLQPVVNDFTTTFKDGWGNVRNYLDEIFSPQAKELRKLKRVGNWAKFNTRWNLITGGPLTPKYIKYYGKRN